MRLLDLESDSPASVKVLAPSAIRRDIFAVRHVNTVSP